MLAAEESLGAIDRQLLGDIDIFAAAVPAFSRITLGVFVREDAALRFHDRAAGEILRGDQFDVFALPFFFRGDRIEDFRIDSAQRFAVTRTWCRTDGSSFNWLRKISHGIRRYARASASHQAAPVRFVLRMRARSVKRF